VFKQVGRLIADLERVVLVERVDVEAHTSSVLHQDANAYRGRYGVADLVARADGESAGTGGLGIRQREAPAMKVATM
jgi:hypothetical protein